MSDNVFDLQAAAEHRAKVLANKRLKRAHPTEWLRYFHDELRRTNDGNDGGAA